MMRSWLCSCGNPRPIASFHNISRSTAPAHTNAGSKLHYRVSGLVLWPISEVREGPLLGDLRCRLTDSDRPLADVDLQRAARLAPATGAPPKSAAAHSSECGF